MPTPEPSPTKRAPPTNLRWLMFSLACGASWILYLHRYTYNFIKPELEREYHYTGSQLGWLFGLFYWTYGSAQVPAGMFCDVTGSRLFLALIIALWSLALAGTGLSGDYRFLAALRLLFGGAQAGAYPALAKVSRVWFPRNLRTTLQGLVATTSGRLGGALSPIVMATLLMGVCGLSWRLALVAMMTLGLVFAGLYLWLYRESPVTDERVNEAERAIIESDEGQFAAAKHMLPLRTALANRSLAVLSVQQALAAGADVIYVSLMGSFFLDQYSVNLQSAGLLASLPLLGGACGGFVGGWLNDRLIVRLGLQWGRTLVGLTGPVLAALTMFVVIGQKQALAAGAALFVVKFFVDWNQPTVWGASADLGGRYTATAFSLINTFGTVGAVVCPPAFGYLLEWNTTRETVEGAIIKHVDYQPLLLVIASIYLAAGLCWLLIDCRQRLEPQSVSDVPHPES